MNDLTTWWQWLQTPLFNFSGAQPPRRLRWHLCVGAHPALQHRVAAREDAEGGRFVDLQSGIRGHVREISLRYTRVTTNDEVDVIVPNSEFVNGRVVNWTFGSNFRRMRVPFGVAYGSDKEAVKAAGLRAAAAVETTVTEGQRRYDVWLVGMGDSSLDFELAVCVGAEATSSPARVEAANKWPIHEELVRAGLEIPFPQRDLHIRSGDLRVRLDHGDKGSVVVETRKPEPGA